MRRTHLFAVTLIVATAATGVALPANAAKDDTKGSPFVVGAPGAGDPYFPFIGNGGYDVQHYDLKLTYTPPKPAPAPLKGKLDAVATITMR